MTEEKPKLQTSQTLVEEFQLLLKSGVKLDNAATKVFLNKILSSK